MRRRSVSLWWLIVVGPSRCSKHVRAFSTGCGVFGRDEGDSEFSFAQQQVDALIERWSQTVRAVEYNKDAKPTSSTIMLVELCVSDKNKPLLLANSAFIPYVVDALLLVRAELKIPLILQLRPPRHRRFGLSP